MRDEGMNRYFMLININSQHFQQTRMAKQPKNHFLPRRKQWNELMMTAKYNPFYSIKMNQRKFPSRKMIVLKAKENKKKSGFVIFVVLFSFINVFVLVI